MIHDPPPTEAAFGSLPTMYSLALCIVTHVRHSVHIQSRACVLMSRDPKVRKTITYSGTTVEKVSRLLIYSMFVFIPVLQREDCLCVFVI